MSYFVRRLVACFVAAAVTMTACVVPDLVVGSATSRAQPAGADSAAAQRAPVMRCCTDFVSIPFWYDYDPHRKAERTLHDFCTRSPDSVKIWLGDDVPLHGPCARHDMCYDFHQHSKARCDLDLWSNFIKQCTHYYTPPDPRWDFCSGRAQVYYAAVSVHTIFSRQDVARPQAVRP